MVVSADFAEIVKIFGEEERNCCAFDVAGLSDIHDSEDAEEEEDEGVGEGEPWGGEEELGVGVEDNLIANGRVREDSRAGSIVGVSSSELVRSMRRISFCSLYEDMFIFLVEGFFDVEVKNICYWLKCVLDFEQKEKKDSANYVKPVCW